MQSWSNDVLLVGNDPYLQETRAAVLRAAGATVEYRDPSEALIRLKSRQFAVMVLCHTLSAPVSGSLLEDARALRPEIKVIQLVPLNNLSFESLRGADAISNPEPAALTSLVTGFLRPSPGEPRTAAEGDGQSVRSKADAL